MKPPHDYVVYDPQGRPLAFLEVKRRYNTDAAWAREWHKQLLERIGNPVTAAVWLITPEHFYTWEAEAGGTEEPKVVPAAPLLSSYFERLKIPSSKVDPQVFEGIVGLWLRDVAEDRSGVQNGPDHEMRDLLRGGEIVAESTT